MIYKIEVNNKIISGFFIINNEASPEICETYKVIYTDGTEGKEFFNGNIWLVEYKHPVKYWWFELAKH